MKHILFDAGSHLGQFCLSNEQVRLGCKEMQVAIAARADAVCVGHWTDQENGRIDSTIWSLPRQVQDAYYPFMDRFFSSANIRQAPLQDEDIDLMRTLRAEMEVATGCVIGLLDCLNCARAVHAGAQTIFTLSVAMLDPAVVAYMHSQCSISVRQPIADRDIPYPDLELEKCYQQALRTFQHSRIDPLKVMKDSRQLFLSAF